MNYVNAPTPGFLYYVGWDGTHKPGLTGDALTTELTNLASIAGTHITIQYNTFVGIGSFVRTSHGLV